MKISEQNPSTIDISAHELGFIDEKRFEKVQTAIAPNSISGSKAVALEIANLIREKADAGENCVLGLATGSSPIRVYEELVRMHREDGLSFQNVITFNLDEYYPILPEAEQSYWRFMHEHLFDHVDIKKENVHIPNGTINKEDISAYAKSYEDTIVDAGGLDLQILGIGRTGHIGFNEPGSSLKSRTRLITLDHITRVDAAKDFVELERVPRTAVTMGVDTIMKAKRIILMAWGSGKASIIKKAAEGEMSTEIPSTFLQAHPNTTFVCDPEAASELTRIKTPWLVGECEWNEDLKRKAVHWLCRHVNKPILKLTDRDYNDHGMSSLLTEETSAYQINIRMFNQAQHTITGWPGGKPNCDDSHRPERAEPARKRVLIFSPHPDDDVISMGGTLLRLVDQGHEVHVAYQTSGNIAVNDHDALRFADFISDYLKSIGHGSDAAGDLFDQVLADLQKKKGDSLDSAHVRQIKGLIRRGEAKAACRYSGLKPEHVHHLDLPFYETGKVKKNPIGEADIAIIRQLIEEVQPHQIYCAGDLADPHGTHKVCLDGIFAAIEQLKSKPFMQDCWVWLYRGAWHEWETYEIDMAVPISPDELRRKRQAIFFHQSQKDGVVFQGNDDREFWQRAEDRNKDTAQRYDQLGLAEYEAIEAFKRYFF
ncbi:MAG: glucosamine-6-phosphate deaminase [Cytophagales bacterium]|nr:glucosamine-6-phosphate deaminase [Cytophagales bacterium]